MMYSEFSKLSAIFQNVTNDVVDPNPDNRTEANELHENETDSHGNQCEVPNVDSNQSEPLNIPDTDKSTKEDISNDTLDDLKNNRNVKIVGGGNCSSI